MNLEYLIILLFLIFSSILSLLVFFLSYFLISKTPDLEKISAYECGFDPFEDTKNKFDVRFYLVGILFIIFDLEITFLFPWAVSLKIIDNFGFFSIIVFLILLTLGFIYEWKIGALDWE